MRRNFLVKAGSLVCAVVLALGLLVGCGACKHEYVNGVCTKCDHQCEHETYENEICTECKLPCPHETYENGVCVTCSHVCLHQHYTDGVCDECKTVCEHEHYTDGVCDVCKIECKHEVYENGVCKECGLKEYKPSERPTADYSYAPYLSTKLPRVTITTNDAADTTGTTFMADATRVVPSFDNNNAANNIEWQYHPCTIAVSGCDEKESKYEFSNVSAGVKVRGNWTTTYPKKPFRIKFDKKHEMLGLNDGAKCKSWVLLADYKDFSLERNSTAFYLGQQILGSDGFYCSDYRQVELYIDNQSWGVYLLAEQQQTGSDRIEITEPDDVSKKYQGTDIGYFIEFDGYYNLESYAERFSCNYNFEDQNSGLASPLTLRDGRTVYPNQIGFSIKNDVYYDDENNCAQKKFIKDYIWNLYKVCYEAVYNHKYYTIEVNHAAATGKKITLKTYRPTTTSPVQETVSKIVDIQSLVDTYIFNEIVCDYDINWSSFLMDVDFGANAKDNLLRFEAPWDFDSAFGLRYACESGKGLFAANSGNPWLAIFINEDWFWNAVKDKWQEMKTAKVQENALSYVRRLETLYADNYYTAVNDKKWGWQVSGEATGEIHNTVHNHHDAATQLYNWLQTRFNDLDKQFKK